MAPSHSSQASVWLPRDAPRTVLRVEVQSRGAGVTGRAHGAGARRAWMQFQRSVTGAPTGTLGATQVPPCSTPSPACETGDGGCVSERRTRELSLRPEVCSLQGGLQAPTLASGSTDCCRWGVAVLPLGPGKPADSRGCGRRDRPAAGCFTRVTVRVSSCCRHNLPQS